MDSKYGLSRLIVELPANVKTKFYKKCSKDKKTMSDQVRSMIDNFLKKGN